MILALQLILSLSLLIILHEAGHFLPAKLFKTRVEKFYLFFDPYFSLIKKKIGETEYGIGWLPLGGYVKISGMVDESMDKDQMAQPAKPYEFRSKPAWQRLIIMVGGVTVNVIVGIVIYSVILGVWGKEILPTQNLTYGVACSPLLENYGFRDGDKIVELDGVAPESFMNVNKSLLLDDVRTVTVERFGQNIILQLPEDFGQMLVDSGVRAAFTPRIPCIVDSVVVNSNAELAGLLKGDSIVGVNTFYSPYFQDIQKYIKSSKGKSLAFHVIRDGQQVNVPIAVTNDGAIGFSPKDPSAFLTYERKEYSIGQAIPAGFSMAWETITDYGSQLKFLFSKSGAKQVGGFATFAKLFPEQWDWEAFWSRTALISLILAFMNILPIPALDGGHVMFLLWEMITGKAANQKVMEVAQMVGMVILLGLMLYGNGMDVVRWLTGK
ncbi:MAG: RIP metalloprotease RseP [Flavobacteriales bacterium]